MTSTIWRALVRHVVEHLSIWVHLDVFLIIWLGLWVLWKNTTEVKSPSHPITSGEMSTWLLTMAIVLQHLVKVVFVGFSTVKSLFFPFHTLFTKVILLGFSLFVLLCFCSFFFCLFVFYCVLTCIWETLFRGEIRPVMKALAFGKDFWLKSQGAWGHYPSGNTLKHGQGLRETGATQVGLLGMWFPAKEVPSSLLSLWRYDGDGLDSC